MNRFALNSLVLSSALFCGVTQAGHTSSPDTWHGYYVGATAGNSWNKIHAKTRTASNGTYFIASDPGQVAALGSQVRSSDNFIGGVLAGYNFQKDKWIYGVEAEIDSVRIHNSKRASEAYLTIPAASFTVQSTVSADWLFTLKSRVGYASDRWLVYASGGLAAADLRYKFLFSDDNTNATEFADVSQNYGWTVGTGVQFILSPAWSIRGEYSYVSFEKVDTAGVVNTSPPQADLVTLGHQGKLTLQNVSIGIIYNFK